MDDPGIEYVDFDEHYGLRADAVEGRARGLRSRRTSAAAQVNRGERFQTDHARALKPGMAEYERLKSEWKAESYEEEEVILASINAKLDAMRKREAEALRLLDGPAEGGVPGAVQGD
jgi:hypothetical protein